jgi:hypothetical protein
MSERIVKFRDCEVERVQMWRLNDVDVLCAIFARPVKHESIDDPERVYAWGRYLTGTVGSNTFGVVQQLTELTDENRSIADMAAHSLTVQAKGEHLTRVLDAALAEWADLAQGSGLTFHETSAAMKFVRRALEGRGKAELLRDLEIPEVWVPPPPPPEPVLTGYTAPDDSFAARLAAKLKKKS